MEEKVLTWFYSNAFVARTLLFLNVLVAFYYSELLLNSIIPRCQKKSQPVFRFYDWARLGQREPFYYMPEPHSDSSSHFKM